MAQDRIEIVCTKEFMRGMRVYGASAVYVVDAETGMLREEGAPAGVRAEDAAELLQFNGYEARRKAPPPPPARPKVAAGAPVKSEEPDPSSDPGAPAALGEPESAPTAAAGVSGGRRSKKAPKATQ